MDNHQETSKIEGNQQSADVHDRLMHDIRPSVFKIETETGVGTGWQVDSNTIATDYHVIRNARQISAIAQDGKRYRLGADAFFDTSADVALLRFVGSPPAFAKPLQLGSSNTLKPGDAVHCVSHPNGGESVAVSGVFDRQSSWREWTKMQAFAQESKFAQELMLKKTSQLSPDFLDRPLYVHKLNVTQGSSGGPILDDKNRVVSLVARGYSADKSLEFSTPVESLKKLLEARNHGVASNGHVGYWEMGIVSRIKAPEHSASTFYGDATVVGCELVGAAPLYAFSTDPMSLIRKPTALKGGLLAAGALGVMTYADADRFYRSTDSRDTWTSGLALASDATMAAGLATRYLSVIRSSGVCRSGRIGNALMVAGFIARMGTELLPSSFVVDIGSKPVMDFE
jgi:hypothetical protein